MTSLHLVFELTRGSNQNGRPERFFLTDEMEITISSDMMPSYLHDAEISDDTIAARSLHHCSLRSEKNQRTVDKLITLVKKVCCQVSPCLSVM